MQQTIVFATGKSCQGSKAFLDVTTQYTEKTAVSRLGERLSALEIDESRQSSQSRKSLLAKDEIRVRVRYFLKFRRQCLATDDRRGLDGAGSRGAFATHSYP